MTLTASKLPQALVLAVREDELVPESHGPFGDYYVPRSKVTRSAELRAALAVLESEPHAS